MTLDLSVVKRIAEEKGIEGGADGFVYGNCKSIRDAREQSILAFAQAIYAMGAAEQKEKDAKICENPFMLNRDAQGTARNLSEAIRSQE